VLKTVRIHPRRNQRLPAREATPMPMATSGGERKTTIGTRKASSRWRCSD
jgi:hypothetical protein